jgi:hypothetical protein
MHAPFCQAGADRLVRNREALRELRQRHAFFVEPGRSFPVFVAEFFHDISLLRATV